MYIVPNELMNVLMANLPDTAIDIHNGTKVSMQTENPGKVVQLEDHSNLLYIITVNVDEHLDCESQVYETVKKKLQEPTDWRNSIILPEKSADESSKLVETFSTFAAMWHERLGTIAATQYRI